MLKPKSSEETMLQWVIAPSSSKQQNSCSTISSRVGSWGSIRSISGKFNREMVAFTPDQVDVQGMLLSGVGGQAVML
jgi:hypothetical protein